MYRVSDGSIFVELTPPVFPEGRTDFINAQRLRIKESDRILAMENNLKLFGINIESTVDSFTIHGRKQIHEDVIASSYNDHRIAMAAAVAGLKAEGDTVIPHAECVNKSYPTFFTDLHKVGAEIIVT